MQTDNKSPAELRIVFRMRRAFSKPIITIDAITKLVKLARSPNTSKIFRHFAFRPVYLEGKIAPNLPGNPTLWKQRFYLMGIAGTKDDDYQNDQNNLSTCIDQAIASRGTVAVHAEVEILSYMHKEGLMRKAMNNNGVSELSCRGCFEFVRAMREPEVIIAGQHGKWYPFSLCCKNLSSQQTPNWKAIRQGLLRTFKHDWSQYTLRKRTASFGNHSESSAISTGREELTTDPDSSIHCTGIQERSVDIFKRRKGISPLTRRFSKFPV